MTVRPKGYDILHFYYPSHTNLPGIKNANTTTLFLTDEFTQNLSRQTIHLYLSSIIICQPLNCHFWSSPLSFRNHPMELSLMPIHKSQCTRNQYHSGLKSRKKCNLGKPTFSIALLMLTLATPNKLSWY